ncbi:MAG: DUF433 domain-containing protein [Phycisphaerales bacterium]|nr:DUF433 domain-containing protein [Phycisphaerales bacterium]
MTMAMWTPVRETHIYLDENGTACVDSPRKKVKMLVEMIRGYGSVEETAAAYPHYVTRAQLHAAMSYYYDHQAEIDEAMRRDDELERELRALQASRPMSPAELRVREAMKQREAMRQP